MDAGAYRLVRQIGGGGTSEVWLAEHPVHGRVAWKRTTQHEVRAASAVSAPGLVRVIDAGTNYVAMELVDGQRLDVLVRQLGRLAVSDSLRIGGELAHALGALHAQGIVHRDVKPDNVVVGAHATLVDFGSASMPGDPTAPTGGTPQYMAPEQYRVAARIDARADVYALGCVLFAMLVGRPPFEGTRRELLAQHRSEPPPRLASVLAGALPALEELVARCLAKDPDARFASGSELAAALDQIADHRGTPAGSPDDAHLASPALV